MRNASSNDAMRASSGSSFARVVWLVIRDVGVHRVDDAEIVREAARFRVQLADRQTGFATFHKLERRWPQPARAIFRFQFSGARRPLARMRRERRLKIERVDLRRTAIHVQMNDVFRAGTKMGRLERQRVGR